MALLLNHCLGSAAQPPEWKNIFSVENHPSQCSRIQLSTGIGLSPSVINILPVGGWWNCFTPLSSSQHLRLPETLYTNKQEMMFLKIDSSVQGFLVAPPFCSRQIYFSNLNVRKQASIIHGLAQTQAMPTCYNYKEIQQRTWGKPN